MQRDHNHKILAAALATFFLTGLAAGQPPAKHPNLLLNREEIEQVKTKIKQQPWAAALLEQLKQRAARPNRNRGGLEAAVAYALTGDSRYALTARKELLFGAHDWMPKYAKADLRLHPPLGEFAPVSHWAWSYDLVYDALSAEDRRTIEEWLRTGAHVIIDGLKHMATTPNLVFDKHWQVGLVGFCLGDQELIEWGLNDPGVHGPNFGGFYQVLDTMIAEGRFWKEAPIYALVYDVHGMLALAEASLHAGGPDLYHYVSKKSGASLKRIVDGYLLTAYPLEKTGAGMGSVRVATFGDGSTNYSPSGALGDTFLVNPFHNRQGEPVLAAELELAYKRYRDPGYAWLIGLNPKRDAYVDWGRSMWGYIALTHGEVLPTEATPPAAPSGVYPSQGFAMLRADESPGYWTSGAMAAVLRLGEAIGHGHKDYFSLVLHGKGRLLYPDVNVIQYEPNYLNWTHEGIAHSTLMVDHQSPRPGNCEMRHDFTSEAKFFAVTGSAFAGVTQTRALLLTPEYLSDVFHAQDNQGRPHVFDWALHGLGRLYPGNPAAYRTTNALVPFYWWVDNERGRTTGETWQADWVQQSAGVTRGLQPFGKEWFEQQVGVRMTMLGGPGTEVYAGDGPIANGPPYYRIEGNPEGSVPVVVARRQDRATTFATVHYPYEGRAPNSRIRKIQETGEAVGLAVETDGFSDRVLAAFQPDREQTLESPDGEAFRFRDYGYVRVTPGGVTVRGHVSAFRVRTKSGKFATRGDLAATKGTGRAPAASATEQQAALHYWFLPEEAHLSAGGEKEVEMHVRSVGEGETRGRLRFLALDGITVEPSQVNVGGMRDGDTKVFQVRVKAARNTAATLSPVRIEPIDEARAPAGSLLVSTGVVITEDTRIPLVKQSVIRAPGYTMKLDHLSGTSYYLLDADGHRRHGRLYNGNDCYGIPALAYQDNWVFRYGQPCRIIFEGRNVRTAVNGSGLDQVRLQYTFREEQIVFELIPPTHPDREYTMWFGNLDAIEQREPSDLADRLWLRHPVYRQGLQLVLPGKRRMRVAGFAARFPVRLGEKVVLQFTNEPERKLLQ